MRALIIHGFNVRDNGSGTIDKIMPFFVLNGVPVVDCNYGWVWLFRLRSRNVVTLEELLKQIQPGDVLVGHSNAAAIMHAAARASAWVAGVVVIQPALDEAVQWPAHVQVLCLYNHADRIVTLGGWWAAIASTVNRFRGKHTWGAAGRYGFTSGQSNVTNWDTDTPPAPARGHSGIFDSKPLLHWGPKIVAWAQRLRFRPCAV